MSERRRIFLLDHSSMLVAPLKRVCSPFQPCEIVQFGSFSEAESLIAKHKPNLVFSNWDLPDIKGLDLISKVHSNSKINKIPLLLFTKERPLAEVQKAMMQGAGDVLGVPIDWNFLHRHLVRLFNEAPDREPGEYEEPGETVILNRLDKVSQLTPIPKVAQQVLAISEDPRSSAGQLAEIVQQDPTITANVLKLVNSAYYGYSREISNIQKAIVVLGFDEVRNITIAASLSSDIDLPESRLFKRQKFWLHSLASATIARTIAMRNPKVNAEDAFIIGLLHDIGDIVLDQHFHDLFIEAMENADESKDDLNLSERALMGVDHAEVGGVIARNWDLPVSLEKAIMYHHEPWRADYWNHPVFLAHISNILASYAGFPKGTNPRIEEPNGAALEALGFGGMSLKEVWENLNLDLSNLKTIL